MPISETLGYSSDEYRLQVANYSIEQLKEAELSAFRRSISGGFSLTTNTCSAILTCGVTAPLAVYKSRSLWVSLRKRHILRKELREKRAATLPKKGKDILVPMWLGMIGHGIGDLCAHLFDSSVSELAASGGADGAVKNSPADHLAMESAKVYVAEGANSAYQNPAERALEARGSHSQGTKN